MIDRFKTCGADEKRARDQLVQEWASFHPRRPHAMRPHVYDGPCLILYRVAHLPRNGSIRQEPAQSRCHRRNLFHGAGAARKRLGRERRRTIIANLLVTQGALSLFLNRKPELGIHENLLTGRPNVEALRQEYQLTRQNHETGKRSPDAR
jgi:hypothetical protein